ncbi:hypothetical protein [uncultured Methanobrevibacter sp.]|uniref:hypothetical protein n=1 Tax=uncultured Methanobrevibacter sp. TaxID=253161 RepID=UPI0025FDB5EC|nr:hypothetical protein [uncultured Methanobrevibacter sp.]
MDIKEIIAIFGEIAVHESEYVPSFTVTCLFEVEVIMENNHKITVLCGEEEFIDCSATSSDGYLGIGDALIKPISDIEEIHLKMR